MDPSGPQLLMLLVLLVAAALAVWIAVRAARRRPVGRLAGILAGLILLYSAALIGVSAASGTTDLELGDTKCFDEWCATTLGAQAGSAADLLVVHVRLTNHGRSPQRSTVARALLEGDGRQRVLPQNPEDLQVRVPPSADVDVALRFLVPSSLTSARFVITEVASGSPNPGVIVIGGESSPHSYAG